MIVISPAASFIQFTALPVRPNLKTRDFALREYGKLNVAFQVSLRNDDGSLISVDDSVFKAGIASMDCQLKEGFEQKLIPLCYRTYIDSFAGTIHLTKIFYADIAKDYDSDVTFIQLLDILLNDFGITLVQDGDNYYLHECCVTLFKIQYSTDDGSPFLTISRFYDRFFINIDHPFDGLVAVNECYRYAIYKEGDDAIFCSNIFNRDFSGEFLTKIKYRCIEDCFDFEYNESEAIVNIITLPLYIGRTQYPTVKKAYKKSDGTNILLSAVLDKQPELFSNYMPEFFHDCLNIALNHDNFYLFENTAYVAYVVDDTYKIEWENEYTDWGQGNTKLKRQLYSFRNDNCKLLNDCCLPPYVVTNLNTETNELTFTIYTSIKTNLLQLRYREIGTEEWNVFEIADITIPTVVYTIDLDTLDYENGFEFQWRQECGTTFSNWTTIVQIGGSDCIDLNIPSIELPNAIAGQLYHVAVPFTGSLPASLTGITKPDWATITIVDNTIVIDGTPTETGTIEITGTISNACNDLPFDFSFDVVNEVKWTEPTNLVEDADDIEEDANLVGPAGASVTVKITTYTNSNGGNLYTDGSLSFLNNTFTVVLDGSGNGHIHILFNGNSSHHSSAFLVRYTIIATTIGVIGTPDTFQTSKAYV